MDKMWGLTSCAVKVRNAKNVCRTTLRYVVERAGAGIEGSAAAVATAAVATAAVTAAAAAAMATGERGGNG